MTGWTVTAPATATTHDTRVVRVDVPFFPDGIEYEDILGRAFSSPADRDWMASGGVVILAVPDAYQKLESMVGAGETLVTERGIQEECLKLALERQIVCLRWLP